MSLVGKVALIKRILIKDEASKRRENFQQFDKKIRRTRFCEVIALFTCGKYVQCTQSGEVRQLPGARRVRRPQT